VTPADEKFAAWLRETRTAAGLSQAAVGDRLGLPQQTVARIETNARPAKLAEAAAAAELFGTTLDAALGLRPAAPAADRADLHRARRLLAHIHDAVSMEIARGDAQ
jgi:transcriptional regulator with XRE-family HTH domain